MRVKNSLQFCSTPHKTCWDKSRKCLFFPFILAKTETSAKWMPDPPPSSYTKLFRIAWQLYTLVFRPRQLWIGGWGGGVLFVFRGDRSRGQKLENRWNCPNSFVRGWFVSPKTNFSSWKITMPLYNSSEVFVPAKQYGNTIRGTQHQFSGNICSEDDLRSRIFGTFVVKFLACLPLLGFSNS